MKKKVNLKRCTLSLLQMIEDKNLWRESLTPDDKDFIENIRALAQAAPDEYIEVNVMGVNSRAIFEALRP